MEGLFYEMTVRRLLYRLRVTPAGLTAGPKNMDRASYPVISL
jgi:hypothetical protein